MRIIQFIFGILIVDRGILIVDHDNQWMPYIASGFAHYFPAPIFDQNKLMLNCR